MSKFNWRNGFTVGLIVGGGLVSIIFLFGQKIYDLAQCYHTAQCYRSAAKYEGQNFPSWWWWDWTGSLVTSDDTLAQWLMSFFTIAAVLLVWRTLVVTQRMAADTRDIGEAQVRAYLVAKLVKVSCTAQMPYLTFRCDIANHGQSPALDAFALVKITFFINDETVEHKLFHEIGDLPVGESEGAAVSFVDAKISPESFQSSLACHIQIRVIARDVFEKRVEGYGFFTAFGGPESGTAYVTSNMVINIHSKIGLELKESDFAHLVPNWRKPNWGESE